VVFSHQHSFPARRSSDLLLRPGDHGSTFGGNPLAAAVGEAALEVVIDSRLPARAAELGAYLFDRLATLRSPHVTSIRGRGLLVRSEEHTSELQSRENLVC